MKKSNILILVFCLSLPLAVVVYHWLMVRTYLAGSFYVPHNISIFDQHMKSELLQPFHYVVIDGSVSAPSAAYISSDPMYPRRLPFSIVKDNTYKIEVNTQVDTLIKRQVKNDTLFIKLRSEYYAEVPYVATLAIIGLPDVKGLILNNGGYFKVSGFKTTDSISAEISGCEAEFTDLETPRLRLAISNNAKAKLNSMPGVKSVGYLLGPLSKLALENDMAPKLKPERVDSTARIELSGGAAELQEFINKNQ
ncbi:hypothetical protein [uncultured Chitinophaga sp.]|uniref:hypothetical protein n=1 Tax=uncultured Chitinophaga sp. TaxID=339340 RepID=UPI0025F1B5EE|nr:hypothetical protein [uncultured Chitinophaga sp.]